jgi:hypothetical protein
VQLLAVEAAHIVVGDVHATLVPGNCLTGACWYRLAIRQGAPGTPMCTLHSHCLASLCCVVHIITAAGVLHYLHGITWRAWGCMLPLCGLACRCELCMVHGALRVIVTPVMVRCVSL